MIEKHSEAKLEVLRRYLRAYFDTLGVSPVRDHFRLDFVDGFAGGGTFRDGGGNIVSGTPLIMLEETRAAQERLNQNRIKPLSFDCKFHFVDREPTHTDHLRKVLREREYRVDGQEVVVHDSLFEDVAEGIIADVRRRQPIAGRAIFLLDQTGFSQVELELVNRILTRLPRAEVILTFAVDNFLNFGLTTALIRSAASLNLTQLQIDRWLELKDGSGGRALIQRGLREHIRTTIGATYDTPFFIRPEPSHRALWFLHFSRHLKARDVMIQCHWSSSNTFEHYGSGDFDMLGWNVLNSDTGALPLFRFTDMDAKRMQEQLLNSMPSKLYALAAEDPVTVDTMRHMLANETAARFFDLDEIVRTLAKEKEINIISPDGTVRSRIPKQLSRLDRIAIPTMRLFPGISRLQ